MIRTHLFRWSFFSLGLIILHDGLLAQSKRQTVNNVTSRSKVSGGGQSINEFQLFKSIPGKKYLHVHPSGLEHLTDDQFLERIQYDYTKLCLSTKDSIVTVEVDGYIFNLLPVAAKNGWINRQTAAKEALQ